MFCRSLSPLAVAVLALAACSAQPPGSAPVGAPPPPVVNVARAAAAPDPRPYAGTTQPRTQVTLRARAEGQLLTLAADLGDRVQQGQPLATLDGALLQAAVIEAEAELAARRFDVAEAEADLADLRTRIEQANLQLQQAQADTDRLLALAERGAESQQVAEQAQTTLRTAQQAYQSAQEQLRTRQQAVAAAQQRGMAQQAVVTQAQQRLAYATLTAPLSGVVLARLAEPGDLVQPGQGVLVIGDLAQMQVVVEIADTGLAQFPVGQGVEVQLDALPGEIFAGTVARVAPVADAASRLVAVEITIANPQGRMGSGLLARVRVPAPESVLLVPATAVVQAEGEPAQVFVLQDASDPPQVIPRPVQVGTTSNGQVEIRAGLAPGEAYVVTGAEALEAGQAVRPSLISDF